MRKVTGKQKVLKERFNMAEKSVAHELGGGWA